ncbi:MAG: glycosyltransferase family 2 protein [Acidobacteriota bacterium]
MLPPPMVAKLDASVVIPTYNRAPVLARTLEALGDQEVAPAFEVLVVDDGSTDATARVVESTAAKLPVPLHYLYQPNRKQGAARNRGARAARGEILVFLGDDIVPGPRFLARHVDHHRRFRDPALAVIGQTTWPPGFRVTPFLDYIGREGWQFGFSLIEDPKNVPFQFFYTSNVSLDRCFFLASGGFDESFDEYGWEDMELAWRLQRAGLRLHYEAEALAWHHHPTDFASFCRRQVQVGRSAWRFYRKHPELAEFLGLDRRPRYGRGRRLQLAAAAWACRLLDPWGPPFLRRFYPDLMTYYYVRGVEEAIQRERRSSNREEAS